MERLAGLILCLPLVVYASSALEGGRAASACDCSDLSKPAEFRFDGSAPPNFASDIKYADSSCNDALVSIAVDNGDLVASVNLQEGINCGGYIEETLVAGSGGSFETLYEFPPVAFEYTTDAQATGKAYIELSCVCPVEVIPDSVKYCKAGGVSNPDASSFDFAAYPGCSDSPSEIYIPFLNNDGAVHCPAIVLVDDFNNQYVVSYTDKDGNLVEFNCPRVGQWSNWSEWSSCVGICGDGVRQRSRACNGGDVGTGECTLVNNEEAVSEKSTTITEVCDTTIECGQCPGSTTHQGDRCVCDANGFLPSEKKWFLIDAAYSASFPASNYHLFGTKSNKVLVYLKSELGAAASPNKINFAVLSKDRQTPKDLFPSNIAPKKYFWTPDGTKLILVLDEGLVILDALAYPFNPKEGVAGEISSMSFDENFIKVTAVFTNGAEVESEALGEVDWCSAPVVSVSGADNSVVSLSSNCDDLLEFCKLDTVCPASVDNEMCLCNHDKNPTCKLSDDLFYLTNDYDSCSRCTDTSCQRKLYGCFDVEDLDVPAIEFTYESCNNDKLYCQTTCTDEQVYTEWIEDDNEKVENCEQKCGEQYYTRRRSLRPNAENLQCSIPSEIKLEERILCNTRCCGHHSEVTSISAPFKSGDKCYKTESIVESCPGELPVIRTSDIVVPCSDPGLQLCSESHVKSCIDSNTHEVKHIDGCQGILFEKRLECDSSCTYGRQTYFYTCGGEEIVGARYTTDEVGVCDPDKHGCILIGNISEDDDSCVDNGVRSCVPITDSLCTNAIFDPDAGNFYGIAVTKHCVITLGDHGIPCASYEETDTCLLPKCSNDNFPCCENSECATGNGYGCFTETQRCYDSNGALFNTKETNCCEEMDFCSTEQLLDCPPCDPQYPACAMAQSTMCILANQDPCQIHRETCTCDNFDCTLTGFDLDTIKMENLERTGLILPQETYGDKLVVYVGHEGTAQKCTRIFDRAASEVQVHYKYNDMVESCGATLIDNTFRAEIYIDSQKVLGSEFFSSRIHFASVQCSLPPPKDLDASPLSMIPRLNPIKFTDVIPGATEVSFQLARDPLFKNIITDEDTTSNMLFIEAMVYARVNSPTAVTIESCEVTDLRKPERKRYIIKNRCILPDMKEIFGMKFTKVASNGNTELEWKNFFFRDNLEDRQQLQYKCFVTHCRGTPCQPSDTDCEAIQRGNSDRRRRAAPLEIPDGVDRDASAIEFWVEAFRYMETLNRAKLTIEKTYHTEKVILVLDWVNNILFTLTFATLIAFVLLFYKRNVDEETKTIRIFEKTFYYGARRRSRDENSNRSSQLPVQIKKIDSGLPNPAFRDF